jgi:DNA-binding NtrC family response regulator
LKIEIQEREDDRPRLLCSRPLLKEGGDATGSDFRGEWVLKTEINIEGARVLIVDDTPENLKVLRQTLEAEGFDILVATSGEQALKVMSGNPPDLVLLDVMMPGLDGFETCERMKADPKTAAIPVIFVTARAEEEAVMQGFDVGGIDYIVKPFNHREVIARVTTHVEREKLSQELARQNDTLRETNERLTEEIAERERVSKERNHLADHLSMVSTAEAKRWGIDGFVGNSQTVREITDAVGRVRGVETTVLITGESGTGKELIARAVHFGSPRSKEAFVPLNCAAIPNELVEATLFGNVKGAFTGADKDKAGYFKLADGGTLFLDEIGEMPADLQAKMLRVLEDGMITPVGGTQPEKVNVRVLAATNADLQEQMASGSFRQDLYFRLARFTVTVPPLRERREDVPLLARHFVQLWAEEMGLAKPDISEAALAEMSRYDFPGNVRELKNVVERAMLESGGNEIRPEHLHWMTALAPAISLASSGEGVAEPDASNGLPMNLRDAEEVLIERALKETDGNIAAAARILGTNRPRIYKHIEDRK